MNTYHLYNLTESKSKGYKIGVISDTSPSLQYILEQLGIAKYFTSFTVSSLVGVGKPNPIIFNAALIVQSVTAQESMLWMIRRFYIFLN